MAAALALADGVLRVVLIDGSPKVSDDPGGPASVMRVPGSLSIVLAIVVGAGVLSGIEPVLPVHLGATAQTVGLLFGLASLTAMVANPVVGYLVPKVSSKVLVGGGVVAAAASLLVIGWASALWGVCIGMALLGASSALLLAPATTLISEQGLRSDPPTLGGAFALYNFAYAAGLAGGPMLTGVAVQQLGFSSAMAVTTGVLAIIGCASLFKLPNQGAGTISRD